MERDRVLTAMAAVLVVLGCVAFLVEPEAEVAGLDVAVVATVLAAGLLLTALVAGREATGRRGLPDVEMLAVVSFGAAGRVEAWNPAALRLFGLDPGRARGTYAADLFATEELSGLRAELTSVRETGRGVPPRPRRFQSAAGETFDAIGLLWKGRPGEVLLAVLDMRPSGPDERLAALLDEAPAGLLHVEKDGRIGAVSRTLAEWVGRRPELLPGLDLLEAGILPERFGERLRLMAAGSGPARFPEEEDLDLPGPTGAAHPVVAVARRRVKGGADVALVEAPGRRRLLAERDAARKAATSARETAAETIESTARDLRTHVAEMVAAAERAADETSGPGTRDEARAELHRSGKHLLDRVAPADGDREAGEVRARVLLVEDDEENRALLTHMLRSRGAEVIACATGREAIDVVTRQRIDLGLLDLSMPDLDGYEVFRRLRALPGGEDLPLVAVTAFTSDFEKERAQVEGFNDFVPKPVTLAALDTLLRRFAPRGPG